MLEEVEVNIDNAPLEPFDNDRGDDVQEVEGGCV
jgi:hypothetical protein